MVPVAKAKFVCRALLDTAAYGFPFTCEVISVARELDQPRLHVAVTQLLLPELVAQTGYCKHTASTRIHRSNPLCFVRDNIQQWIGPVSNGDAGITACVCSAGHYQRTTESLLESRVGRGRRRQRRQCQAYDLDRNVCLVCSVTSHSRQTPPWLVAARKLERVRSWCWPPTTDCCVT